VTAEAHRLHIFVTMTVAVAYLPSSSHKHRYFALLFHVTDGDRGYGLAPVFRIVVTLSGPEGLSIVQTAEAQVNRPICEIFGTIWYWDRLFPSPSFSRCE
jgi:hypothetical protein